MAAVRILVGLKFRDRVADFLLAVDCSLVNTYLMNRRLRRLPLHFMVISVKTRPNALIDAQLLDLPHQLVLGPVLDIHLTRPLFQG